MWIFKYMICLFTQHMWVGSSYKYCLRCGKVETKHAYDLF
jgi:hypothetical protein